jgi:hypothetical protein
LIANDKNRFRWVFLGLSQDGAGIDLFENHSENSLKEDLSNVNTSNLALFSSSLIKLLPEEAHKFR